MAHAHSDGSLFIYWVAGGKGAGGADAARTWQFWLIIDGEERLETDIYAHYLRFGSVAAPDNTGCDLSEATRRTNALVSLLLYALATTAAASTPPRPPFLRRPPAPSSPPPSTPLLAR